MCWVKLAVEGVSVCGSGWWGELEKRSLGRVLGGEVLSWGLSFGS